MIIFPQQINIASFVKSRKHVPLQCIVQRVKSNVNIIQYSSIKFSKLFFFIYLLFKFPSLVPWENDSASHLMRTVSTNGIKRHWKHKSRIDHILTNCLRTSLLCFHLGGKRVSKAPEQMILSSADEYAPLRKIKQMLSFTWGSILNCCEPQCVEESLAVKLVFYLCVCVCFAIIVFLTEEDSLLTWHVYILERKAEEACY